ncbi:hypothetical protein KKG22_05325 [Patescibacteria group bacterium]|nr:hypothetical protein [Patescibacteria group bacterium]MBU1721557.1 hypothetical protein [Patescibacteria group bacterium]MBU1901465.1 hypothetical protein [Patescibacteria group bacterium]
MVIWVRIRYLWIRQLINSLHVHNVEQTFAVPATGTLAKKVTTICWRSLHFAKSVLLPTSPSSKFVDYVAKLYGQKPGVYVLSNEYTDGVLNTLAAAMKDIPLINTFRGMRQYLTGYVNHHILHDFANRVGLSVLGVSQDILKTDLLANAGNKVFMAKVFRQLGLRPHVGVVCKNLQETITALRERLWNQGEAFVRQGVGDGGLGNLIFTYKDRVYAGNYAGDEVPVTSDNLQSLFAQLGIDEEWCELGVLVEKKHQLTRSPAILIHIDQRGKVRVVQIHEQLVTEDGGACIGILRHFKSEVLIADMELHAQFVSAGHKIGDYFAEQGVTNTFMSIDTILCEEGLLFSEINPRQTAACVGLFIGYRLGLLDDRVLLADDQFKTSAGDLESALDILAQEDLLYNKRTRKGIVITNEPHGGSMGMMIVAKTTEESRAVYARVKQLLGKGECKLAKAA